MLKLFKTHLIHKKAMMDDFFDLIFTVMVCFFLLFFINFTLQSSTNNSNKQSLEHLADYKRLDSAITNLRVQLSQHHNLNHKNIPTLIENSKIIGGKVITNCRDYFAKEDCAKDIVNIHSSYSDNLYCEWNDNLKTCEVKSTPLTTT